MITKVKPGDRVRYDDTSKAYDVGTDIFEGVVVPISYGGLAIRIDKWIKKSGFTTARTNQDLWGILSSGNLDSSVYTLLNNEIQPIASSTTMLPTDSRCKYDDVQGNWRVLFQGRLTKQVFKTVAEANAHLRALNEKKVQPEYAA